MKITKLKFQNINSLKGLHTIDFEKKPLSTTGIFAITGAIGSGKSTLLDVITLALFNRTPRFSSGFSKNTLSEHGAIITKGTAESFTEVEYIAKKTKYRSKWSISVNRNGNLRDYEMELSDLQENKILPLQKREIPSKNEEILGLSYDQFVKSILLSQGEFSKFLKANASERSDLLEKITGVDIYRKLGIASFERHKLEKEKLKTLNTQLEMIETISQDEQVKLISELEIAKNSLAEIAKNEKNLNGLLIIKKELIKNSSHFNEIKKQFDENELKIKNFQIAQRKLDKHEKLIPFQNNFNDLHHLKQSVSKLQLSNNELIKQASIKTKLLESFSSQMLITTNEFNEKKRKFSELIPVFEKVTSLDTQKSQLLDKVIELKQENEKKLISAKAKKNEIQQLKKEIETNILTKKEAENYLNKNKSIENLAYSISNIESDIVSFLRNSENFQSTEIKLLKKYKINISYLNSREVYNSLANKIAELNNEITEIQKKTSSTPKELEKLETQRQLLLDKHTNLSKLIDFLKLKKEIQKQINLKFNNIERLKILVNNLKSQNADFLNKKEIASKYIEELSIRYERQLLEKNYAKDRKLLKKEEACPLCGSTHHPYIQNYHNELNTTQSLLKEKKKEFQAIDDNILSNEKQRIQHLAELKANYEFITEKENAIKQNNTSVKEINKLFNFENLSIEEIKLLQNKTVEEGKKLRNLINLLKKQNDLNSEKSIIQLSFEKSKNLYESEQKLTKYKEKYSLYLTNITDYNQMLKTLKLLSQKFEQTQKQLSQSNQFVSESSNILEIKENNLTVLSNEIKNLEERIELLNSNIQTIKIGRHNLLGNKDPKIEEKTLIAKIEKKQKEKLQINNQIIKLEAEINSLKTNLSENKKLLKQDISNLEIKKLDLNKRLALIGFSDIKEAEDSLLNQETVGKIKSEKQELENFKISLQQSLNDKKYLINELASKDDNSISIKVLEESINTNNKTKEENNKNIGIISNQLKNDAENRKRSQKILELLEKQEKEVIKWECLKKIIGDSTGKTFTDYAQKLTLKQLFSLANKHLKLIDGRYLINTRNTLNDIFILDSYQGNASRSIKTLSGGESFLVSLALALGLSDLAGKNTQINSLFIDEGFGTLDQQSLDTALSALEKLQSESNKTIGIISHLSSLKERIQTQIQLTKSNSGFSKMEIVG